MNTIQSITNINEINANNLHHEHMSYDAEWNYLPHTTPINLELEYKWFTPNNYRNNKHLLTLINLLSLGHKVSLTLFTQEQETTINLATASFTTVYAKRYQQAHYLLTRYSRISDPVMAQIARYYLEDTFQQVKAKEISPLPNLTTDLQLEQQRILQVINTTHLTGIYQTLQDAALEATERFDNASFTVPRAITELIPTDEFITDEYPLIYTVDQPQFKFNTISNSYVYSPYQRQVDVSDYTKSITKVAHEYLIGFTEFTTEFLTETFEQLTTTESGSDLWWELYYRLGNTLHSKAGDQQSSSVAARLIDQSEDAYIDTLVWDFNQALRSNTVKRQYKALPHAPSPTKKVSVKDIEPATEDGKYYDYYEYLLTVQRTKK